jgi:hypothetical protein
LFWQVRYVQLLIVLQSARKTYYYYKLATSDEYVLCIWKETRARTLNQAIVSKSQGKRFKQKLTERFRSDLVDICIVASGNEGEDGLRVAKAMC